MAFVWRTGGTTVYKMVVLWVFSMLGWVKLNPATSHHGVGKDWLVLAILGCLFGIVTMAVLQGCYRLVSKTRRGWSLALVPIATLMLLVAGLAAAPRYIALTGDGLAEVSELFVVGVVLAYTPFGGRKFALKAPPPSTE